MRKIATLSSTVYGESKNKRDKELTRQGESMDLYNVYWSPCFLSKFLKISTKEKKGQG
jgi:hypothetical protein